MQSRPLLFFALLTGIFSSMTLTPQISEARGSVSIGVGTNHYGHHGSRFKGHHPRHNLGINSHRSFGFNRPDRYQRYKHSYQRPHNYSKNRFNSPHYPHRPQNNIYRYNGISLGFAVPLIYSSSITRNAPITRQSMLATRTIPSTVSNSAQFLKIDAWAELSRYQTRTAINGFKAQSRQDSKATVPKVGFSLATATEGEYEKASWAMAVALKQPAQDLHYFRADQDLMLVLEELRLHYREDAFMSAALLYLLQQFQAADTAINDALAQCNRCDNAVNLQQLIQRQL